MHVPKIMVPGSGSFSVSGSDLRTGIKRNLSLPHMKNAVKRCKELNALEKRSDSHNFGEHFEDYRAEWLSAVTSCAASAEAYVNELIDRMRSDPNDSRWGNKSLLDKTKIFLKSECNTTFDKGLSKSRNMKVVLCLRNAIMHFKPYYDDENAKSAELENALPNLVGCKLVDVGSPFFPMRCVSSDYAIWATRAALCFVQYVDELVSERRYPKHFAALEMELATARQ